MKKMTKKIGYVTAAIFMLGAFTACYNEIESEPRQAGDLLPIGGAYNVRDLGGYTGADGKHVKSGKLIRAGSLDLLTDRDQKQLFEEIGVKTVVDFRSKFLVVKDDLTCDLSEQNSSPDRLPDGVARVWEDTAIMESMIVPDYGDLLSRSDLYPDVNAVIEAVKTGYERIVVGDTSAPNGAKTQYKAFFDTLLNSNGDPVLFHCSAGKDRTGVAAALLLSALGVDRETIIKDYLESAENVAEKYYPVGPYIAQVAKEQVIERHPGAVALVTQTHGNEAAMAQVSALKDSVINSIQKGTMQRYINAGQSETQAKADALQITEAALPYNAQLKAQFDFALGLSIAGMKSLAAIPEAGLEQAAEASGESSRAKVQPLLTVRTEYIEAALDAIKAQYPAKTTFSEYMNEYLINGLGLSSADIAKLKDLYLEP